MKVLSGRLPARRLRGRDPLRRRAVRVPRHPGQRAARHRDHPPGARAGARTCRSRRTSSSATSERHARPDRLEPDQRTRPATLLRPGRAAGEPGHPVARHRRRQAAAGRDRQGAVQGGEAADPRRADRRAQRRGLRAPARPAARAARRGHHLRHHLAQAERDRRDRRLDHHPARRPDDRDARHARPTRSPRTGSSPGMVGRDLDHRFPPHEPHDRRGGAAGSRTGRCTARPSTAAPWSPTPT